MVEQVAEDRESALVREEVRTWLQENWKADIPIREWRQKVLDSGWGVPDFPAGRYGKGFNTTLTRVVAQEFQSAGAPGFAGGMARSLASPSIVEHGTDEQVRRLVGPALLGDVVWCQLFSEPGAGSDLAGVTTTAILSGDEWVVNGQKVWTSGAVGADMGMLVCRTDWDVPKHRGISWIGFPMKQEGVDVRPLRQMTGGAGFNEVFITDGRAPKDNAVGGVNDGWKVALTTLAHERGGGVMVGAGGFGFGGFGGGAPARAPAAAGAGGQQRPQVRAGGGGFGGMMGMGGPSMIDLAREKGKNTNAAIRQQLVKNYILGEIGRFNSERARAARAAGKPGPEGSLTKLHGSDMLRSTRELGMSLLGADGMLAGSDAPFGGSIQMQALFSCGPSIFGGTDQIQHNIIGERVLGLPKEPSVDDNIPFREVKTNASRRV